MTATKVDPDKRVHFSFRFDYVALQQALIGTEGKVDRCHIHIDRNANIAQFIPELLVFERVATLEN